MANKKNFYAHAKAKRVVKALGIKSILEYRVRYSEDSKLPAAPDQVYAGAGWKSWRDLFGMKKTSAYSAYGEAQEAVQKLGIKNIVEYRKRYREDPRLPSSPNKVYAGFGWVDWFVFFGKRRSSAYLDYVEAQKAAQALGIKTRAEYIKRFREDGKLPAFPHITYSSSGWVSYYEFLGSENPDAQLANYPIMLSEIERWVKAQSNIYAKKSAARDFLSFYYKAQCCPDDPRYLLLRRNPFNIEAYQQFIESLAEYRKKNCHSAIRAFFGWLLDEYCTDTDADERVVLPEYRNPFVSVLAGFSDSLPTYRPNQSTKPPLGYEFILRARNYLVPKGEQVLHTRPKLKDLPHLQDFLLVDLIGFMLMSRLLIATILIVFGALSQRLIASWMGSANVWTAIKFGHLSVSWRSIHCCVFHYVVSRYCGLIVVRQTRKLLFSMLMEFVGKKT